MRSALAVVAVVAACRGGRVAPPPARDAATGSGSGLTLIDASLAMPIADCPVPHGAEGKPIDEEVDVDDRRRSRARDESTNGTGDGEEREREEEPAATAAG